MSCTIAAMMACDRDEPEPELDRPALRIVETFPEAGAVRHPLERAMRIRFDRYLRPASVVRQSVLVTPGLFDADSGAPKGPVYFFEPVYDPYERMVVLQLSPRARWIPSTLHLVRLLAPEDESSVTGFQAFDGAPLVDNEEFFFVTGDAVSDPANDIDDLRPTVRFCATDDVDPGSVTIPAFEVLRDRCASSGCHGSDGEGPVYGLDLSSSSRILMTTVRVVARQTLTGPSVGPAASNSLRLGDDMARIDPGNAGNSYLVYKLLVNPGNHPEAGEEGKDPWLGGLSSPGPPPREELERLRSRFVRGEPMPLGGQLRPDEMRSIVRWILQGANTPECP